VIDITGLDKRDVLAALYNKSRPLGMGFLHHTPDDMTREEAGELLEKQTYFDYLRGRVMKVRLDSDTGFEEWLYDRDNGKGAAQSVVDGLRQQQQPK